ncbi:MAG: 3'(2'),5'-bisphosphate nucleotidase CysQ family protein [Spirochaetota bacterium]
MTGPAHGPADRRAADYLLPLLRLAARAGDAILEVYESDDVEAERKADDSPLTLADRRAHDLIDAGLRELAPEIPILSEEGAHADYAERSGWRELWLVDPLDGTKEFLKRNGEFTVNIALVRDGEPVAGVVYAPVRGQAWAGVAPPRTADGPAGRSTEDAASGRAAPGRAWKLTRAALDAASPDAGPDDIGTPISVRDHDPRRIVVIASRTHLNDETKAFVDRATAGFDDVEIVNVGSSLKLCYVAEGRADLYPRYAPTSEWDTAAGHAVVRAAGGEIYQAGPDARGAPRGHTDRPLRYNKENLLNPWFVVRAW